MDFGPCRLLGGHVFHVGHGGGEAECAAVHGEGAAVVRCMLDDAGRDAESRHADHEGAFGDGLGQLLHGCFLEVLDAVA